MTLAVMLAEDKDALICDMAETYHILDIKALPVELLAVLASGLREDSRIKMKLAGMHYIPITIVAPQIFDNLQLIRMGLAGDKSEPYLLTERLLQKAPKEKELLGFASAKEFEAEWARRTGGL